MTTLQAATKLYLQLPLAVDTIKAYRSRLNHFIHHFGPDRELATFTLPDLIAYFHSIRKEIKPITEWGYAIIVKTFFKWCVEMEFIQQSPADRLKLPKVTHDPLGMKAIPRQVLDQMQQKVKLNHKRSAAIRNYAILCFLDETACRRGAVPRIQISKLNFELCEAYVLEKGGEVKTLAFTERTAAALIAWLDIRPDCDHDFVFTAFRPSAGYPALNRETISIMFRRLSKKVSSRTYGPHSCRHHVAQEMKDHGEATATIQDKLNHKNVITTQHYLGRSNKQVVEATRRRAERIGTIESASQQESSKIIYVDFAS